MGFMPRKNVTTSIEMDLIENLKYLAVDTDKSLTLNERKQNEENL
jgi:hypothetical protein